VTSTSTLRVATAYGVFGLVGFVAQVVVAMEGGLLPIFAWYWACANAGDAAAVPSPHEMSWGTGRYIVFVLWLLGVPALAGGLAFDALDLVRAAAWGLLVATILDSLQAALILHHAYARPARGMTSRIT